LLAYRYKPRLALLRLGRAHPGSCVVNYASAKHENRSRFQMETVAVEFQRIEALSAWIMTT